MSTPGPGNGDRRGHPGGLRGAIPKSLKLLARLPGLAWHSGRVGRKLGFEAGLGMFAALTAFWSKDPTRARRPRRWIRFRAQGYPHAIHLRAHTSDVFAADQVLVREEYHPLTRVQNPRVIIDCGANIGCTSVYLLTRFPEARLIAVEPDAENCSVCERNLSGFGRRATVLRGGIWHRDAWLCVERGKFRDGLEWSYQVRECAATEPGAVPAFTIDALRHQVGADRIDILKLDVEGTERLLFSHDCDSWLERTDCLAVEVHDDASRQAVLGALARHPFDLTQVGETTYCFWRPSCTAPATGVAAL